MVGSFLPIGPPVSLAEVALEAVKQRGGLNDNLLQSFGEPSTIDQRQPDHDLATDGAGLVPCRS